MSIVLRISLTGLAALALAGAAWAQSYPTRAVRVIVPAGPGGPDVVGRIVAAKLTEQLGQTFFVENHPGANGIVGADIVAKAAPDGYTLMVYSSGLISNKSLYKKLPYDTDKDFAPISNLVDNGGLFITVNPGVPANSLKELIELRSEEHTSELQSLRHLVCRLLLEKKKKNKETTKKKIIKKKHNKIACEIDKIQCTKPNNYI